MGAERSLTNRGFFQSVRDVPRAGDGRPSAGPPWAERPLIALTFLVPTKDTKHYSHYGNCHSTMATSIQVSRELHARLKALKERMKAKTFEDLLGQLLERPRRSPRERFGAHPKMRHVAHRDESHDS